MLPPIKIPRTGYYPSNLDGINKASFAMHPGESSDFGPIARAGPRTDMERNNVVGHRWINRIVVKPFRLIPWNTNNWAAEMQENSLVIATIDRRDAKPGKIRYQGVRQLDDCNFIAGMGLPQFNLTLHEMCRDNPDSDEWKPKGVFKNYRIHGVMTTHPDLKGRTGTDRAIAINSCGETQIVNYCGLRGGDHLFVVFKQVPVDGSEKYVTGLSGSNTVVPGIVSKRLDTKGQPKPAIKYVTRAVTVVAPSQFSPADEDLEYEVQGVNEDGEDECVVCPSYWFYIGYVTHNERYRSQDRNERFKDDAPTLNMDAQVLAGRVDILLNVRSMV